MATDFNPFENMPWMVDTVNVPVPVVDPAELKIVWELQHKVQQMHPGEPHPGEQTGVDFSHHLKASSPDANPFAVGYRLSMLGLLSALSMQSGVPLEKLPWIKSGKPDEFVFKALATLPMNGTPASAIEELRKLIQKEYGTRPESTS
jgi:hypothetical protein